MTDLWGKVVEHRRKLDASGELAARRRAQQVKWMWTMFEDRLRGRLASDSASKAKLARIEAAVAEGTLSPTMAVEDIARALGM
jgi:LAO/AO transport system kinase